ncbi:hypothetical protein MTO96_024089 [Rhipicephalus appendiculatus]
MAAPRLVVVVFGAKWNARSQHEAVLYSCAFANNSDMAHIVMNFRWRVLLDEYRFERIFEVTFQRADSTGAVRACGQKQRDEPSGH